MNEIDINIEGFNVNGICVGCLNYNRKMFYRNIVKDCFLMLSNIDVPDGLSVQVCWECLAAVKNVMRFKEQITKSYEILRTYSKQHTFLNSPCDLTRYASTRLGAIGTVHDDYDPNGSSSKVDVEVKNEKEEIQVEIDIDNGSLAEDIKKEEIPIELSYSDYNDDLPEEQDDASEDDVQLSQLKKEKKKKEVKKKKKGRKKKGESEPKEELPTQKRKPLPDSIETFTMSETEMWALRESERDSAEWGARRHRCQPCLMAFSSRRLLTEHVNRKHQLKGTVCYQCDVCKSFFLTKEHVATHRALHLVAYRCVRCNRVSAVRRHAVAHAAEHRTLACRVCGVGFSSRSKLAYHRNKHHKEKLQCDCCGKVFASKMTLKYHLKVQTEGKEDKPKEKTSIPCRGCPKVFRSKKSYQAHVVIHNGLTYPCPVCGKTFQWKRNLSRHMRNHRERDAGNTHECRPCGKTFASRECLVNHMRLSKRHVPEDAYVHACSYCGKKFASKWCMVDHVDWDHLKRIKYQCNVCFKAFKTAKIMVTHMRNIHEGKKKEPDGEHLCEVCGKSYKTVKRLKGHVWSMHTNRSTTKSFKCKLCPATFTWQTSVYKHVKMMHDSGKRAKPPRAIPPIKKQEPYEMELANRMQYFQAALPPPAPLLQNIV